MQEYGSTVRVKFKVAKGRNCLSLTMLYELEGRHIQGYCIIRGFSQLCIFTVTELHSGLCGKTTQFMQHLKLGGDLEVIQFNLSLNAVKASVAVILKCLFYQQNISFKNNSAYKLCKLNTHISIYISIYIYVELLCLGAG